MRLGEDVTSDQFLLQVEDAARRLDGVAERTPLQRSPRLSDRYGADVLLKREDLQTVRSFKIRGAYNRIASLTEAEQRCGVVTASAGNHAQGVAFACSALGIRGTVFVPVITPNQKIDRIRQFGGELVEVRLVGNSYDEAGEAAQLWCAEQGAVFVHPFDDPLTIAGQATIGREILAALGEVPAPVVVAAVGGGGLLGGIASYLKLQRPGAAAFGAEPAGAASMQASLAAGRVVSLDEIDTFIDGAAVKTVGRLTLERFRRHVDRVLGIPEGKVCGTVIELYQNEGIISEPAGALAVAALDDLATEIRGQTVVCVLSGGNNDIARYPEILERSLVFQGLKCYLIVEFAQKPGQLRRFVDQALGPTDDIVRFEYIKKTNRERGAALVGIELKDARDLEPLLERMAEAEINFRRLSSHELLYDYLI